MENLLLVDGSNLLFQMFYGMPQRIVNKDGKAIHGVLGFIGALGKIIQITSPTHLVILFDGEHPNARTALLADYKANRMDYSQVTEADNPYSQLSDVYSALTFMGVRHTEVQAFEADDIIASYTYTFGQEMPVVIASFDSDFFQLISDSVKIIYFYHD